MAGTARRILDLPNGIHFRKFRLSWSEKEDIHSMEGLLAACSDSLEYLSLCNRVKGIVTLLPVRRHRRLLEIRSTDESTPSSIDLSTATNLKRLLFCSEILDSG